MPDLTIPAIVIRQSAYRDNDRMLTLLSPDLGRVDVLARGCRRPKSPLLTASELFATGEFVLYEKNGRHTLTSAAIHESYYPLRLDYGLLDQAVFLLKLSQAAAHIGEPSNGLFKLLIRALFYLSYRNSDPPATVTAFMICYAALLGYQPEIHSCVKCLKPRPDNASAWFDEQEGGIVCTACKNPQAVLLSGKQLYWLETVLAKGFDLFASLPEQDAPYLPIQAYLQSRI